MDDVMIMINIIMRTFYWNKNCKIYKKEMQRVMSHKSIKKGNKQQAKIMTGKRVKYEWLAKYLNKQYGRLKTIYNWKERTLRKTRPPFEELYFELSGYLERKVSTELMTYCTVVEKGNQSLKTL